ncbi:MAG: hypothetical protein PVI92_05825 [Chromatiales bacterium]
MQRADKHRTLLFLAFMILTLPASATPLICDPLGACNEADSRQSSSAPLQGRLNSHRLSNGIERPSSLVMSDKQQARLITLIENQAADRHEIRQTARQALIRLQQLAIEQHYDETQARQLAQTYGNALAELALLDIQVASQIHDMLTPLQREALQNTIENW